MAVTVTNYSKADISRTEIDFVFSDGTTDFFFSDGSTDFVFREFKQGITNYSKA